MSQQVTKTLLEKENQEDTFAADASPNAGRKERESKWSKSKSKKAQPPPKPRERSKSNYSIISLSEVTEGALQIWRTLPEKIRQDPSLASFRQENERLHGKFF